MAEKKSKSEHIKTETKAYIEFFQEPLEALEQNLRESQTYSEKLNRFINNLSENPSRGSTQRLMEAYETAVELQSQKQQNIKEIFNMKKAILDYTFKEKGDDGEVLQLFKELKTIAKISDSDRQVESSQNVDEINEIINKQLNSEKSNA